MAAIVFSDLTLVLQLNTDSLSVSDYSQSVTFVSSAVKLYEPACFYVYFLSNSYFTIRIGYLQNVVYKELILYLSSQRVYMTEMMFSIPYIRADNQEFVFVLESQAFLAGTTAILSEVLLSLEACPNG